MSIKYTPSHLSSVRSVSAQILYEVHFKQHSLNDVLNHYLENIEPSQHALLKQLCFGSTRWYIKLDSLLKKLIDKPLKSRDAIIHYVLIIGLYQLIYLKKPEYAVVKETVDTLKQFKRIWAKALVNAVLRRYIREKQQLNDIPHSVYVKNSHPKWLFDRLQNDWTESQVEYILTENNKQPPMWLRVNQQQIPCQDYKQQLKQKGILFESISGNNAAILLHDAVQVEVLPGFERGHISVQDGAAQYAAILLSAKKADKVLDACAAPGGKTAHILEQQQQLTSFLAIDISYKRLQKVTENIDRLQLQSNIFKIKEADAIDINQWWNGEKFDRILLDAPCSATGVIRRHPDIKMLRKNKDIDSLVETQQHILTSMWEMLKPGGTLLYATCSILKVENSLQIKHFINKNDNAIHCEVTLPYGQAMDYGWQVLPGEGQLDGFYYAMIKKQADV